MFYNVKVENQISHNEIQTKITALWAFSEAALGGILHVLKIPLTGLFIGSSAVIFISLIAFFSNSRKDILKSFLKVIIVKFIVSPYTPLNAYFAVLIQSLLGYILFFNGFNKISPIILGILSLLFSAFQKVFVLTIIFGMTLWESINIFFNFTINQIAPNLSVIKDFDLSYFLISLYIIFHLAGGIFAGIYASHFPKRFQQMNNFRIQNLNFHVNDFLSNQNKHKKKQLWQKPSNIGIFLFSLFIIFLSYLVKDFDQNISISIITMLFRSIIILAVWYYFISPLVLKILNNFLIKRKQKQAEEVEQIVSVFPIIKSIIKYSWNETEKLKSTFRIFKFFDKVLIYFLLFEKNKFEETN
ncbi:MAG: hypothetical protein IPM32_12375 [Ignavibacteriae bacterium]|nr:hypothetical protein [Ignavibacteriota bacterium]